MVRNFPNLYQISSVETHINLLTYDLEDIESKNKVIFVILILLLQQKHVLLYSSLITERHMALLAVSGLKMS